MVARPLQVSGGGVPMFESDEGTLSILSHFVTVKLNIRWPPPSQRQVARCSDGLSSKRKTRTLLFLGGP